jgi:hypothetical protein
MAAVKFGMGDTVRFVGTETPLTVKQYHKTTREYRLQCGDDFASSQWVLGIYLELVKSAQPATN